MEVLASIEVKVWTLATEGVPRTRGTKVNSLPMRPRGALPDLAALILQRINLRATTNLTEVPECPTTTPSCATTRTIAPTERLLLSDLACIHDEGGLLLDSSLLQSLLLLTILI